MEGSGSGVLAWSVYVSCPPSAKRWLQVMSRIEEPANREGLEMLELDRAGLDAAMPDGKGAGADQAGKQQ